MDNGDGKDILFAVARNGEDFEIAIDLRGDIKTKDGSALGEIIYNLMRKHGQFAKVIIQASQKYLKQDLVIKPNKFKS